MSTSHTLYRFFDANGVLLYVGRTISPARRWREHERGAAWYDAVASVTREVYATAEEVDQAERAAIGSEAPLHNIALTGKTRTLTTPQPIVSATPTDTHQTRLLAAGVEAEPCDGDETFCECAKCHRCRESAFEELHTKYDWHPVLGAEIDRVEAAYYKGAYLSDWYYDLFDIDLFGRMRLVSDSKERPIPTYVVIEDSVGAADCPICGSEHRYVLPAGMSLDTPVDAACALGAVPKGGRLLLIGEDWLDIRDRQYAWGDEFRTEAAA